MNQRNQIIITTIDRLPIVFYISDGEILDCMAAQDSQMVEVGDIFVGQIEHIVKNISAAFVKITETETAYLPLSKQQLKESHNGAPILVQVVKAPVKTKQAVLSTTISLTGKYCVVENGTKRRGISKKITEESVRARLHEQMTQMADFEGAVIMRTNAANAKEEDVLSELESLIKELDEITTDSKTRKAPVSIGRKIPFYERFIRRYATDEYERILTDDKKIYNELIEQSYDVTFYEDESYSINLLYGLKNQLKKALKPRVWLKSGGNIIIEPTEALTVIDVNTGKAIEGKRQKETTFFKINVEAAIEAAKQMRLRNLSGIILIDFIEMNEKENQRELISILKKELEKDKTPCRFIDRTALGLAEITRMKKQVPLRTMLKPITGEDKDIPEISETSLD